LSPDNLVDSIQSAGPQLVASLSRLCSNEPVAALAPYASHGSFLPFRVYIGSCSHRMSASGRIGGLGAAHRGARARTLAYPHVYGRDPAQNLFLKAVSFQSFRSNGLAWQGVANPLARAWSVASMILLPALAYSSRNLSKRPVPPYKEYNVCGRNYQPHKRDVS
jgi:hypothetical protein